MDEEQHGNYVAYIQEKYFRSGTNTSLSIRMDEDERSLGTLLVDWSYTFLDLGFAHSITRPTAVVMLDPKDALLYVDGIPHENIEQAEDLIFGGYYANYIRDLYAEEGITTDV